MFLAYIIYQLFFLILKTVFSKHELNFKLKLNVRNLLFFQTLFLNAPTCTELCIFKSTIYLRSY